ncbi:MAG: ATP-grasp domain-containing protein [Bacteroidota bacterium]|nr:ATP-grasp domain-containing protein [Bacteroidota bacterium]
MTKPIHIAIIYNEPTVETDEGRKFASEAGIDHSNGAQWMSKASLNGKVDLSEIGVIEQKEDIQSALISLGYETSMFNMSDDLDRFLAYLKAMQPDIIFNMVECLGDEAIHEMHVAGIYELLEFSYTGAGPLTLGTCLNKARAKEILSYNGIPTAKFMLVTDPNEISPDDFNLRFPIIVKPSAEDASAGIDNDSIVNTFTALKEQVKIIVERFKEPALVEEYIEGRELNVAIMGNDPATVLPISEIDFSGLPAGKPKIVTYDAKWMEGTEEYEGTKGMCPADLPKEVERYVKELSLKAYHLMGCRDYARVDIRLSKNLKPYVLEVNPNPDLSNDAGFYRSAKSSGLSYAEMIGKIVEFAVKRHSKLKHAVQH